MIDAITELNKVTTVLDVKPVRTIIAVDATGSMSHALKQVCDNIKTCVTATFDTLNEKGVKAGFEIQIAVYRNYNSEANKLFEYSPFSSNPADLLSFLSKVQVEGGWGNEAIENLFHHILNEENDVNQAIVIGDAAGNTKP